MPDAVAFIQWESYVGGLDHPPLFSAPELRFSSRQARLHAVAEGESLWLVSRSPVDRQYYFVGVLQVRCRARNEPDHPAAEFGAYAIEAERGTSADLGTSLRADGLLRGFVFATGTPIKHGASIGQSLQTIRELTESESLVLRQLKTQAQEGAFVDAPFGLWTKCDAEYASYFRLNWQQSGSPQTFLLYDPPPILKPGSPIFIHSDSALRIVATLRRSEYVSGFKSTIAPDEREQERDRIWTTHREGTLAAPTREQFAEFWDGQNGVRGLFVMDELEFFDRPPTFAVYGKGLEWGYPRGVGYRYLKGSEVFLLMKCANASDAVVRRYLLPRHQD